MSGIDFIAFCPGKSISGNLDLVCTLTYSLDIKFAFFGFNRLPGDLRLESLNF
jgi:hypothetical protein